MRQVQGFKLFIQIPCLNEAPTLPIALKDLPRRIPGVESIHTVVIDDGSSDDTIMVARAAGVQHILQLKTHQGLARAFSAGLKYCLDQGADIIVNLDGDNQYFASDVERLISPIMAGKADIVLGARNFDSIQHFSALKVFFQKLGSRVVSQLCRVKIPDAATGFRAFSRSSARKINIFTKYTYTLETLIQAAHLGEKVVSVSISVNPPTRPSRLFGSPVVYVIRSVGAMIRLVFLYNPLRAAAKISVALLFASLWFYFRDALTSYFFGTLAVLTFISGLVLDQISVNRRMLEAFRQRLDEIYDQLGHRSPEGERKSTQKMGLL